VTKLTKTSPQSTTATATLPILIFGCYVMLCTFLCFNHKTNTTSNSNPYQSFTVPYRHIHIFS